ncbi:MAG: bifunctional riboflavin kinase/FAD synthetase [Armatimonadetes bacterium]|nr:bifunctional riboflavin kinase/FAD synthetase [Armatimonadota bacterium]
MRRVFGLEALPSGRRGSAVTIGKFFAVHLGHQALLRATLAAAREREQESVVLTFDRHPGEVLFPARDYPLLATLEERLEWIEAAGVDQVVVLAVTPALLAQEPEVFVREVLVERLHCSVVVAGAGFRFGRGAAGSGATLERLGRALGFHYQPVPPVLLEGVPVSSSRVAECIGEGRVAETRRLLGRPYGVPGRVVEGDRIGRTLGFPTANVAAAVRRLLPARGVYSVRLQWGDQSRPGVANLGTRPTVGGEGLRLEVHLLDWTGDLYHQEVRVEFYERIRGEERFPDLDSLRRRIAEDVRLARAQLA